MESITFDPHINYFKNQIEAVLAKKGKSKHVFKNEEDLLFATTDKKEY